MRYELGGEAGCSINCQLLSISNVGNPSDLRHQTSDLRPQISDLPQPYDPQKVHHLNDRIRRVELKPPISKIDAVGAFMVIILKQFSHHQEIQWKAALAMVVIIVIRIAVFMSAPVHNSTMNRAHQEMYWQ